MTLGTALRDLALESGFIRIESHGNSGAIKVWIDHGMGKVTLYAEPIQLDDSLADESFAKMFAEMLRHIRTTDPPYKQSVPPNNPEQPNLGPDVPTFFR